MELQDFLKNNKDSLVIPRSSSLSEDSISSILTKFGELTNIQDPNTVTSIAAILLQQGGTARSCDGNMGVSLGGHTVKLATFRKAIKECGFNRGERKFARTCATTIKEICLTLEIPGNLYRKIQRIHPSRNFSMEEKVWLSDFQHLNQDTPEELRSLISQSFDVKTSNTPASKFKKTGK